MENSSSQDEEAAPTYTIPSRRLAALEHPMIIKNLDKGIRTFGQNNAFQAILDSASPQISVPLYLRFDNPSARPLTSHNALTHNVVLKVTVPKRTGRKRKRGTDGPWEGDFISTSSTDSPDSETSIMSRDRLDEPKVLRRKLQDNVGKYQVEPIGVINNTHRYRGLADFQFSLAESKFMKKFVENVLPGDVDKLKKFSLVPGIETGDNIDLIPPPYFTPMSLPFGYGYAQNPHTKEITCGLPTELGSLEEDQEYERVVNVTSRIPAAGYFIAHDEYPVPDKPRRQPDMSDPQVAAIITEMQLAMEERPIWTRRSMWNRLGHKFAELPKNGGLVRHCLQYAGYQFKGGPWRDALVKYGLDPRSDPKYRIYQTLIFKLHKTRIGTVGRSWQAVRRNEISVANFGKAWDDLGEGDDKLLRTHIFNGKSFSTDGKVWQVCDITDPLLASLFSNAEVRSECDNEVSGFYHRVLWSVSKAIMKTKMVAVRFGRALTDDDFSAALEVVKGPNDGGDGGSGNSIGISLPDLNLSPEECEQLRGKKMRPGLKSGRDRWTEKRKKTHYRVRIPLKDVEEKEAAKMIKLITRNLARPASSVTQETSNGAAADNQTENAAMPSEKDRDTDIVRESIEEDEEDGDVLQEILMDEDEDGTSTDDDDVDDEDEDEGDDPLGKQDIRFDKRVDEREDQDRGMVVGTDGKAVRFLEEDYDDEEDEEEDEYPEDEEDEEDDEEDEEDDEDEDDEEDYDSTAERSDEGEEGYYESNQQRGEGASDEEEDVYSI
ncbi:RNA polymerase III transcription factor IIIC subunit-domain-containing protein [Podospora fimiseda]|uniref:RNA polymerase III transcription factor IIIC subunit-domain-containing protein n=1 Tax=Podospora fimiseda TaxID=252190 RepID=A0AAN7H020_9PEZI|nr:RNA polymerase III transcription factor IIIC subunit-domain-containing protein [Podospora fimiseda]